MANMTLEEALAAATVDDDLVTPVDDVIMIDPETRTIIVPESEMLFGVEEEQWVERKHFKCPRIVGDNIDLSTHQIYISYISVKDKNANFDSNETPELYWCYDVEVDETGKYITFSWLLSGNVLKQRGFIGFTVIAKSLNGNVLRTRWKTAPAVGTVQMTIPDGTQELINMYPDIITQLLDRMDSVEEIATEEAMQRYVDAYMEEHPVQLDPELKDNTKAAPANLVGELKGDLANYESLPSMFVIGTFAEQEGAVKTINEYDVTWEDGKSIYAIYANNGENHIIGELSTSSLLKLSDYIDIGNDVSKISITIPVYQAVTDYGTVYYNADKSIIGGRIMVATGSYGIETVEIIPPTGTKYIRTCYFQNSKSYHTIDFKIDVYGIKLVPTDYGTDKTLTQYNKVADAKAVGDAIQKISNTIEPLTALEPLPNAFTVDSRYIESLSKSVSENAVSWTASSAILCSAENIGSYQSSSMLKRSDYIEVGENASKIAVTLPKYKASTNFGTVFYDIDKNIISGLHFDAVGVYAIGKYELILPENTAYVKTCYFNDGSEYHTEDFQMDIYKSVLLDNVYTTDTSLSMENKVADAKATGDAIMYLTNRMKSATLFSNEITVNVSDWVSDPTNASDSIDEMIKFSQVFEKRVLVFDIDVAISRAILLPSNTTVLLKNCTITQADGTFDNVFRGENVILDDNDYVYVPEDISQLKNIKIIGEGNAAINGPSVNKVINSKSAVGHEFGARTHQIDFTNVEGLEIRNITFNRTRGWCIELEFVSHFELSDLVFHTAGVKNGDGIDIRGGCKYGNVYNISGDTGDDTVAFNTHVSLRSSQFSSFPNSTCYYPLEFGYKYNIEKCTQDPTSADIHDVSLNNISKEGGSYHICIFLAMYGHRIYNISMSNLLVSGNVVVPSDYSWVSCYNYEESTYNAGDISGIRANNYINEATHTGYSGSVSMLYSNLELLDVWVNGLDNKNTGDVLTNLSHADGVKVTNSKTV